MKLFRVQLQGVNFEISYAVAIDATTAYKTVRKYYDKNDIGFTKERELKSIELVAEDVDYPDCGIQLFFAN